ncbi:peptidase C14 caspase catalytic subunit p20, partial [Rhodopirellula maiorica SM1]
MIRLVLFSCVLLIAISQQAIAARHALLIGCSDYKTHGDLHGSGIDVALLKETLSTPRFGFGPDDLTVLSDADPTTKPPTFDNIHAAFETVVAADWAADADPDVLLIYMSGHGGQRESETENDGTDEFFMPIDESDVILDDQIGNWLSVLDRKGIHTWIVFDSCFSGTMTRGDNPNETVRGIAPASEKSRTPILPKSNKDVGWELPTSDEGRRCNVVAFYACQAYEKAIEDRTLDESDGAPVPHGLFTYCLLQCLEQHRADRDSKLSYEELRRGIIERYRALGRTWPTPFCEGNLTQEVLGFEKWPHATALRVENIDGNVSVAGGQLVGITNNAILAVYEPKDRKQESPIGYLKVTQVTATTG